MLASVFALLAWGASSAPDALLLLPWSDGVAKNRVELADVLAIVQPAGPAVREQRPTVFVSGTLPLPYAVLPVTVVSGVGCKGGDTLRAVLWQHARRSFDPEEAPVFDKDARFLLVGLHRVEGRLRFPLLETGALNFITADSSSEDELSVMAMLPTLAKGLAGAGNDDSTSRLCAAAIECMDTKDDEAIRRACRLLRLMPPGVDTRPSALPYGGPPTTTYCPEDATVKAVKARLAKASPYAKSLIWGLLLRWRVPGSFVPYRDSLAALAGSPGPYCGPLDADELLADLELYRALDGSCWYDAGEFLNVVTRASNVALLRYFLRFHTPMLSSSQCEQLAPVLRNLDAVVRYLVVDALSRITGDKDHAAKEYAIESGRMIQYPDLDVQVAYWMRRYGVAPP